MIMILPQFLVFFSIFAIAAAKQIYGVVPSITSIGYVPRGATYIGPISPATPLYYVVLSWGIDGTHASAGDTFILNLPGVFDVIAVRRYFSLNTAGVSIADCLVNGGNLAGPTSVTCTVAPNVAPNVYYSGRWMLPLVFDIGGSMSQTSLDNAKNLLPGINKIKFNDGKNTISLDTTFNAGPASSGNAFNLRTLAASNQSQTYLLASNCADGYSSGTLGITFQKTSINCETLRAGITNDLNSWLFPKSYDTFEYQQTCTNTSFTITYSNIPSGYRPFIDVLSTDVLPRYSIQSSYVDRQLCIGGISIDASKPISWNSWSYPVIESGGGIAQITTTWPQSYTSTTTLASGPNLVATVEILIPVPSSTTTTTTWLSSYISTRTVTGSDGTNTIIIETPFPTTTTTTTWANSYVSSSLVSGEDGTNTLVIQTPFPTKTTTTTWLNSFLSTTTVTGLDGTNTVIVETPFPTTTTTATWLNSIASTTTLSGADGTNTLIIETPYPTATTVSTWLNSYISTTTVSGLDGTNTVIIETPFPTKTTTTTWSNSDLSTTTVSGSDGTNTVIFETPSPTATVVTTWTGSFLTTTTIVGIDGTNTVLIETPSPSSLVPSSSSITSLADTSSSVTSSICTSDTSSFSDTSSTSGASSSSGNLTSSGTSSASGITSSSDTLSTSGTSSTSETSSTSLTSSTLGYSAASSTSGISIASGISTSSSTSSSNTHSVDARSSSTSDSFDTASISTVTSSFSSSSRISSFSVTTSSSSSHVYWNSSSIFSPLSGRSIVLETSTERQTQTSTSVTAGTTTPVTTQNTGFTTHQSTRWTIGSGILPHGTITSTVVNGGSPGRPSLKPDVTKTGAATSSVSTQLIQGAIASKNPAQDPDVSYTFPITTTAGQTTSVLSVFEGGAFAVFQAVPTVFVSFLVIIISLV